MKNIFISLLLLLCLTPCIYAQNPSAILDLESTTQGFLPPRMDTTHRNQILFPSDGMIIYNTSTQTINYYNELIATWEEVLPLSNESFFFQYFRSLPHGIQVLLNLGYTPLDLISQGVSLDEMIGLLYAGGIIFYLENDGTGLVAATKDQSAAAWGCNGIYLNGNISTAFGTGATNTQEIISECSDSGIAARICDDLTFGGFDDWYLPSVGELAVMWENLADSDSNGTNTGVDDPNNIGGFEPQYYSSSSQGDDIFIYSINFLNGNESETTSKTLLLPVRAIRSF